MIITFPVENDKGADSRISEKFGEAEYFFWLDSETGESGCAVNTGLNKTGEKGRNASAFISELSAEAVIVRSIGCAAVNRLRGLGITAYTSATENITKDLELFKSRELPRINAGDCDSSCK